ncbi:MAG: signal peptidase I [Planctomycetes bacterium]|nr:signal peptidase I [Planctomycetota bacterium]
MEKTVADSPPELPSVLPKPQVFRETVESLAVAFILALLFKSFVADAFIIPTGSMAPTLMGAHKDIQCEHCGYQYQSGASEEFDNNTGARKNVDVTETVCPICRKIENIDIDKSANHATFYGDRILVSKLAYALGDPKRWQVIVFKFIEVARQNYIKRCVGLPGETLKIWHGDIYVKDPKDPAGLSLLESHEGYRIARKPASVVLATLQDVADTKHLSEAFGSGTVPDPWQDESKQASPKWQTTIKPIEGNRTLKYTWSASVTDVPKDSVSMLRFRHRVVDNNTEQPKSPDDFRFITDFTAYNHNVSTSYDPISKRYSRDSDMETDGSNWVGDIAGQWQVSTTKGTQGLELLLVEGGVEFLCRIDLSSGKATATAVLDGKSVSVFESSNGVVEQLQADTPLRSGSTHRIRYANVDDALRLWIDDKLIPWGIEGGYSILAANPDYRHLPRHTPENPLDAAPLGIGIRGGSGSIQRAQVLRDIFYTASLPLFPSTRRFDEPVNVRYSKDPFRLAQGTNQEGYSTDGLVFQLGQGDYFPMGDNTQASSDARMWNARSQPGNPMPGQPGRLMIGRAVMVFWPHSWYLPKIPLINKFPFIPNFQRIGLIR